MADSDSALYVLRYNQVSQAIEGQGGTPQWNTLTLTNPDAAAGITQLTGDVTAGPGAGSQVTTIAALAVTAAKLGNLAVTPAKISTTGTDDFTFPRAIFATNSLLGTTTAPTTTAREVLSAASGKLASAITGLAIDASTSTDGLGFYLLHNAANNRQLGIGDTLLGPIAATAILRLAFTPDVSIDAFNGDLSGSRPLTLGNASATTTFPGLCSFSKPPTLPLGVIAGTGTVTPVGTASSTFSTTVTGNLTLNGPSAGVDGQRVMFRILNDASHSVTLATGAGNFRFGADITAYTNSVSLTDYIGAVWNSSGNRWDIVSIVKGY